MSYTNVFIKNNVRVFLSDLTSIANEAIKLHKPSLFSSYILAKAISIFVPLNFIKNNHSTSIFLKSDGLIKNIIVEANEKGDVRVLIGNKEIFTEYDNNLEKITSIPTKLALGNKGFLKIVQENNNIFSGSEVELKYFDLVGDLAYYFAQSEQINTAVLSSVIFENKKKFKSVVSAIFQMLPNHKEEDIQFVENFIQNNKLDSLKDYETKLEGKFLKQQLFKLKCSCSNEKMSNILKNISQEEKEEIIKKVGKLEIVCNWCNSKKTLK